MQPEKGDKSIHVNVSDVRKAFLEIGAQPGDTVMFHGSLSSMGTVDGGPGTVFDGALEATAPGGTVAMPSLWYDGTPTMLEKDFDVNTSPAYTGAMSEAMRKDPRSKRSNQYTHAVAAIGARALELTKDHGAFGPRPCPWSEKAFAVSSPWTRLVEWNALYCFIGVTIRVATIKHWIEGEIALHYINALPEGKRMEARMGLGCERNGKPWGYFDGDKMQKLLEQEGLIRKSKIGSATLLGFRTRQFVQRVQEIILPEPEKWYAQPFLDWIESLKVYK